MPGIGIGISPMLRRSSGVNWATRTPSNLYAIVYRDTEADLTWTDPSGDVPFRIYISTDGVNYTEKGTTIAGDNTYTATGLTAGTLYYFKVVAYIGEEESPATNVWDTYMKWTIDTTKAGSSADTFVLPVIANTGSYFVDWGDGGSEEEFTTTGNKTHIYAAQGTYQLKVRGGITALRFNNGGDRLKLIYIDQWGNIKWSSCLQMFYGCSNMIGRYFDQPNTMAVTVMSSMFRGCVAFNQSVSNFNTAKVTSMSYMFQGCYAFNQSVSSFNTAEVTDMTAVFRDCVAFNQSVSNFNTAKVTNMGYMFYNCSVFNQSVSSFNTAEVTLFVSMFQGCYAFNQSVINFNTAKVTSFASMFQGCYAFNQSLATFSLASATNLGSMLLVTNVNAPGTTINYDDTLVAWAAQNPPNGLTFSGGNSKYGEGFVDSGITSSAAASKLIMAGQNFSTTVEVDDVVYNITDGTFALVTAIDSDVQLSISPDIMASGESFRIQHSDAAKARAKLILTDLWTITDLGADNLFNNGQLVLTFDDSNLNQYTIIFEVLVEQGEKATFYITPDLVGSVGHLTWTQIQEMSAAGMDIQCHCNTHTSLTLLSEEEVYAQYDDLDAAFVAHGIPAAHHTAYPNGEYNEDVMRWTATRRLTARTTDYGYVNPSSEKFNLPNYGMYIDINLVKSHMLTVQSNNHGLILYAHLINEFLTREGFNEIIDYAQSIGMSIVTISELYDEFIVV